MKLLILYEELAGYFVNCINTLAKNVNTEILVICKEKSDVAPFVFDDVSKKVRIVFRNTIPNHKIISLARDYQPTHIFLGGWAFKPYLQIVIKSKRAISVLGFDNHWTGTLRQRIGAIYFRVRLRRYINGIFVPGIQQKHFAKRLGFTDSKISLGAYCCDFELFHNVYLKYLDKKTQHYPKRFLFIGRYEKEKGIVDLWNAFIELYDETHTDWELWCVGKGSIPAIVHPKIKHFDFLQPAELQEVLKDCGVFVLPSTFEPWGVVVHECAAAGLPLLCSSAVGSAHTFLSSDVNGVIFPSGDIFKLKEALRHFVCNGERSLIKMSQNSSLNASRLTPDLWVNRFLKLYEK